MIVHIYNFSSLFTLLWRKKQRLFINYNSIDTISIINTITSSIRHTKLTIDEFNETVNISWAIYSSIPWFIERPLAESIIHIRQPISHPVTDGLLRVLIPLSMDDVGLPVHLFGPVLALQGSRLRDDDELFRDVEDPLVLLDHIFQLFEGHGGHHPGLKLSPDLWIYRELAIGLQQLHHQNAGALEKNVDFVFWNVRFLILKWIIYWWIFSCTS